MPYFYSEAEVEVEVGEFLESCKPSEIKELIQYLKEDGHLSPIDADAENVSIMQGSFKDVLVKLQNAYFQLSNEEIELIQNIAKKY